MSPSQSGWKDEFLFHRLDMLVSYEGTHMNRIEDAIR